MGDGDTRVVLYLGASENPTVVAVAMGIVHSGVLSTGSFMVRLVAQTHILNGSRQHSRWPR